MIYNKSSRVVDAVISKALDTEIGKQVLNEFQGVLSKVVIVGSVAFTLFLMYKFNSWLSVSSREGETVE